MSAGKQCKEAMQKLRLAEFERDQAVLRAARTEAERARAEKFWASAQERAEKMEAERDALTGEVERLRLDLEIAEPKKSAAVMALAARAERAEAALREIEQATEGIPEQNCMLANRIARLALLATAPAEGFFARGEDGQYHPDPPPACPHGNPPGTARDCACRAQADGQP